MREWVWAAWVAALLTVWQLFPILSGQQRVFYRDLATTHLPAVQVFPTIGSARANPHASFGQPYVGNPNLLVAYRRPVFRLNVEWHLAVHFALGFCGMLALVRSMRRSASAALVGATSFSFSGYVLSSLSFLNATTTIAWIPWVMWICVSDAPRKTVVRILVMTSLLAVFAISGEPAIILSTGVLAAMLAFRHSKTRGVLLLSCAVLGILATLPVHRETWAAARESARVVFGFTWAEAAGQSMHPVRLFETVLPGVFGSPAGLLAGAWWGFRFSANALPYVHSVALLSVPTFFAIAASLATRGRREPFWLSITVASLLLSMFGLLPLASRLFAGVVPFQLFRYPVKFMLFVSLALSILAATGWDYWWQEATERAREIAARVALGLAACFLICSIAGAVDPDRVVDFLARAGWNPRWHSTPGVVLRPIVYTLSGRLLIPAIAFAVAVVALRRPRRSAPAAILLTLVAVEGTTRMRALMPTVNSERIEQPSNLVIAARGLRGPICELAWKDIDSVRTGLHGRYGRDHASELAIAQARQGWAMSGARFGIRYAYNNSPDGSYTWRNHIVQKRIEDRKNWDYLFRWLRASGVAGVIAPGLDHPRSGVSLIASEETIGVPACLFKITNTLPPVRRVSRVVWASSAQKALAEFEAGSFDEITMIVVESSPMPLDEVAETAGTAILMDDRPDELRLVTDGSGRSMVFVARSFTRGTRAWVNGVPSNALAANVHLLAVPVPAGRSEVVIRF